MAEREGNWESIIQEKETLRGQGYISYLMQHL